MLQFGTGGNLDDNIVGRFALIVYDLAVGIEQQSQTITGLHAYAAGETCGLTDTGTLAGVFIELQGQFDWAEINVDRFRIGCAVDIGVRREAEIEAEPPYPLIA